jgi:hypothetical protein
MTAEPALASVSLDILRPERLSAVGVMRADGVVELDVGDGEPAEIGAEQLPNVLAENLHLGPRPRPPPREILRCDRAALDVLLDEPAEIDMLLRIAFGVELDDATATALRALAAAPRLHWRLHAAWGADRSRTCEIVDAGPAGAWRVATLGDELDGGILLGAVSTTEIWRRLATVLPADVDLGQIR